MFKFKYKNLLFNNLKLKNIILKYFINIKI